MEVNGKAKVRQGLVDMAVNMYSQGANIADICREMEKSVTTVYQLLREGGIVPNRAQEGGPKRITDVLPKEIVDKVVADYVTDVSMARIIRNYELSVNSVYKILRETNTPLRRGQDYREIRHDRIEQALRMYKDGAKLIKIEIETGIQSTQLYKELGKAGIPLRREQP